MSHWPLWTVCEPRDVVDYLLPWVDWPSQEAGALELWTVAVDADGVAWTYCLTD